MAAPLPQISIANAASMIRSARGKVAFITGAGVSTESGIPDYRGPNGRYQQTTSKPLMHQEFMGDEAKRKRFWARAVIGFKSFKEAHPNRSHYALASLEKHGLVQGLITQNVDRLHHAGGSKHVIELHGRGDLLECQTCGTTQDRMEYQADLQTENHEWLQKLENSPYIKTADGDAIIDESITTDEFQVLPCDQCKIGIMKPSYVFFGGNVPPETAQAANSLVSSSQFLFLVGTTSSTFSCYRLARLAREQKAGVYIINQGATRADPLADGVFSASSCGEFLERLAGELDVPLSSKEQSLLSV